MEGSERQGALFLFRRPTNPGSGVGGWVDAARPPAPRVSTVSSTLCLWSRRRPTWIALQERVL